MMLHVRDCPGTTSTYDICPFPWCRKTKHLLYHLVSCLEPEKCSICTGKQLTMQLRQLRGLNSYRRKKQKEKEKELAAALSSSNKASATANPSNNQNNQVIRKKAVLNNVTVQSNEKVGLGQSQTLSISKETQTNKKLSLSVPSPIPSVRNVKQEVKATSAKKHGQQRQISSKNNSNANTNTRLANRSHLTITAPANPLLSTRKDDLTPTTQNPIKSTITSTRPLQPTANPLKQSAQPSNIVTSPSSKATVKNQISTIPTSLSTGTKAASSNLTVQKQKAPIPITTPTPAGTLGSTSNVAVQNQKAPLALTPPAKTSNTTVKNHISTIPTSLSTGTKAASSNVAMKVSIPITKQTLQDRRDQLQT